MRVFQSPARGTRVHRAPCMHRLRRPFCCAYPLGPDGCVLRSLMCDVAHVTMPMHRVVSRLGLPGLDLCVVARVQRGNIIIMYTMRHVTPENLHGAEGRRAVSAAAIIIAMSPMRCVAWSSGLVVRSLSAACFWADEAVPGVPYPVAAQHGAPAVPGGDAWLMNTG